jgi:rubrerythrin
LRKPRAFYLALNIIKQYSKLDADVYGHLKEKINKKAVFWRCCVCGEKKNQVMLLT